MADEVGILGSAPMAAAGPDRSPAPYTKAERLLNLLMALRAARYVLDRDAIRSQVRGYDPAASDDAFTRMFERDKDDLRAMGIEVQTVTDGSGVVIGYRADPDDVLPDLHLDREELAVVALAARLWERTSLAPAARNALAKFESRLGLTIPSQAPDPAASAGGFSGGATALSDVVAAAGAGRVIRFEYRKPGAGQARREVEPWRVIWWHGAWYLVGWDRDRQAVRVFRVSRITGRVVGVGPAGAVVVPEGFDARSVIGNFAADRPGSAVVALAPGRGAGLRRQGEPLAGDAAQVGLGPGWELLRVDFQELTAFVGQVAGLGDHAVVVSPQPVRELVADALQAVVTAAAAPRPAAGRSRGRADRSPASAQAQFARMLALVPWLAAHDGVTIREAAEHFGITPEQLLADLGSVITSGVDDWTLFDIQYWDGDGVIRMIDPLGLDRPLALGPDELLAVIVALEALGALAGLPGHGDSSVIGRALGKLRTAGPEVSRAVDVRPDLPEPVVAVVAEAQDRGRTVELSYLGATRDELTQRTVDPISIVVVDGYSYLLAHCRSAGEQRFFRLDRIISAAVGDAPAQPVSGVSSPVPMAQRLASSGFEAVVDVAPAGGALLERHPVSESWDLGDWELGNGWVRARMPIGDPAWLESLALSSAGVVVVREPVELAASIASRAASAAAKYHF